MSLHVNDLPLVNPASTTPNGRGLCRDATGKLCWDTGSDIVPYGGDDATTAEIEAAVDAAIATEVTDRNTAIAAAVLQTIADATAATVAQTQAVGRRTIRGDATANNVNVTLPTCVDNTCIYTIKKVDGGANTVKATALADPAETINGAADFTLADEHDMITIQSDGVSNWEIIGAFGVTL
jgi:hypothetical protein